MINVRIDKTTTCNGDYGAYLTFPYSSDIVSAIRTISDRHWDANNKVWEIPLKKLADLTTLLPNEVFDITGNYVSLEPIAVPQVDYEFKTKPFAHQIDGFNYGLSHNAWLLGDEQGLGKTKQVIDIACAKKAQFGYKHCLIICGVNGLKWNWQNEIEIHSNEKGHILGQKTRKNGTITIGSTKDKVADIDAILDPKQTDLPYFLITNVESLRDDEITLKLAKLCKDGVIGMIAADEVHKMKNISSQQGKGFLKLNAECKIAMSGTPLMNTPLDLYMILNWLGFEKHSFYAFKKYFCLMGGFMDKQVVGYKHLDELQESLDSIMLRRLKDDVLDLPEKLHINEYVDMTAKQSVLYKEIAMEIRANIDKISLSPDPLAQMIRLRQATGYTGILSSTVMESAKLDRMEELVEDAVANGKKVVVFSNWTQVTNVVEERLAKYNCRVITGETKDSERQGYVYDFQNDDSVKVMIGTIGAMGTGLTLTAGTVEIFLDEPWNQALKDQAEDRCHRIGAKENVTIYTLMAKNTIDERIHEIVESKGNMANAIVDGAIKNVDNRALIDYLLS